MKTAYTLAAILLAGTFAPAQELTPYTVVEIEQYLSVFKTNYKNKKVPQDDAVSILDNLLNAHKYIASKETKGEASKEQIKTKKKIVKFVALGLKARKRELVTLKCAKVLGEMGDKDGAKPLLRWMDSNVLDSKSANPNFVEAGFMSIARIGGEDKATLDFVLKNASGRGHQDMGVARHALKACYEWRALSGKNRQEFFKKISGWLGGLWSLKNGTDQKKRGGAEKKYNAVKSEGLKALTQLAGSKKTFRNPAEALLWWKDNKKRKWEPYVGVGFRKGGATSKEPAKG